MFQVHQESTQFHFLLTTANTYQTALHLARSFSLYGWCVYLVCGKIGFVTSRGGGLPSDGSRRGGGAKGGGPSGGLVVNVTTTITIITVIIKVVINMDSNNGRGCARGPISAATNSSRNSSTGPKVMGNRVVTPAGRGNSSSSNNNSSGSSSSGLNNGSNGKSSSGSNNKGNGRGNNKGGSGGGRVIPMGEGLRVRVAVPGSNTRRSILFICMGNRRLSLSNNAESSCNCIIGASNDIFTFSARGRCGNTIGLRMDLGGCDRGPAARAAKVGSAVMGVSLPLGHSRRNCVRFWVGDSFNGGLPRRLVFLRGDAGSGGGGGCWVIY